jgi:TRAP-type mannitol/chloroaromatic compound transport system substrate-binding protein
VVPALQVMDAAAQNSVEIGWTAPYYYTGKDPSLVFGSCLPFGLNARQQWAWWHNGGGAELMAPVFRDQGVHAILGGNTGAQMGGWFRKEIRSVEDLKGLKFRVAGYAGDVIQKLGAVAQQMAGPDIYPALERGVIDGAEWVGPYDDEKLGFHRIAPFYYYPGWWEAGPSITMMVNLRQWEGLPPQFKAALETACGEGYSHIMGRYDVLNPQALRRLIAGGAQLRPYPREVIAACFRAAQELWGEIGARNARFKQIHEQWDRFRQDQQAWFRVAEDSFAIAVAQVGQQQPR